MYALSLKHLVKDTNSVDRDRQLHENFSLLEHSVLGVSHVYTGVTNADSTTPFAIIEEVIQSERSIYKNSVYNFEIYGNVTTSSAADDFDFSLELSGVELAILTRIGGQLTSAAFVVRCSFSVVNVGSGGLVDASISYMGDADPVIVKGTVAPVVVDLSGNPLFRILHSWKFAKPGNELTAKYATANVYNEDTVL